MEEKNSYFIFFIIMIFCTSIKAQDCTGYEIIFKNQNINKEEFIKVFSKFNYERYRPKYLDYIMHFNNGIDVKLVAADKLNIAGCTIVQRNDYPSLEFLQKNINYFQFNEKQGTIMAAFNINNTK